MPSDEDEMLREMGLRSVDDLFADILAGVRIQKLHITLALRHNRQVSHRNYGRGTGIVVREVDYDRESPLLDLTKLKAALSPDVCGVYVDNPNFFARFEEQLEEIRGMTNGVLVVGVNPIAQAVVRPPGDFGADLVVGDRQPLGTQMNFGGPLLGIFACRQSHIRTMPGRAIR